MLSEHGSFITYLNQYRAENGVQPVDFNPHLTVSCFWHAFDCANNDHIQHQSAWPERYGLNPEDRARTAGWAAVDYTTEGGSAGYTENILWHSNNYSAEEAIDAWKTSSGHNENMLRPEMMTCGFAKFGLYWVMQLDSVPADTESYILHPPATIWEFIDFGQFEQVSNLE